MYTYCHCGAMRNSKKKTAAAHEETLSLCGELWSPPVTDRPWNKKRGEGGKGGRTLRRETRLHRTPGMPPSPPPARDGETRGDRLLIDRWPTVSPMIARRARE
eukprot:scaffold27497_cov131-Isochrysis_galbana.AAC.4